MNAKALLALIDECGMIELVNRSGRDIDGWIQETILRALRLLAAAEANDGSTPETDDAWTIGYASDNFGEAINQAAAALINREQTSSRIERERNGLAARVGELEKDAERYRWLREGKVTRPPLSVVQASDEYGGDIALHGECLDAAIDAARSK